MTVTDTTENTEPAESDLGPGVHERTAVLDNGAHGSRTVRFETGRLARQAAGAVVAYLDDETMLLSATTASKRPKDNFDFFPLTVDVEERMYAVGRIPGSFFRREGRPSTDAILTCRLIDRPLRPTFVGNLRNEVQVVITVQSLNPNDPYDVLAINAASASTQISGLPFDGPIGATRMALISGQWVAFPTWSQLEGAVFDMVIAGSVAADGSDVAIAMVEAEATEQTIRLVAEGAQAPTEDVVAAGIEAAKPFIRQLCEAQSALYRDTGTTTKDYPTFPAYQPDVLDAVTAAVGDDLAATFAITAKQERDEAQDAIKDRLVTELAPKFEGREKEIGEAFRSITKSTVRQRILADGFRLDGRGATDIRPLAAEVEVIPRAHGSALFERGETQILGVTTLNMLRLEQNIDSLGPESTKRYMHHYNFPPFSTGETGRVGSPKRREIGHGALAERALMPVLPTREEFPYAIRQVSEALGSNGSTSMGSVCASTMSLLNAGVPLKAPVAGIAMGLVTGEVDGSPTFVALTDILGAEDAFGDMDFKVAGTAEFVTALQLDTKIDGLPSDVLSAALRQAHEARTTILAVMHEAIAAPRADVRDTAPKIVSMDIPIDKIGEIIGPKGKVINTLQQETGTDIAVDDDGVSGTVTIGAKDGGAVNEARRRIELILDPPKAEVGRVYPGKVVNITKFGAFVNILPGRDGLVHISKLGRGKRVERVEDVVDLGDDVEVRVDDIDPQGKVSLSLAGEAAGLPTGNGDSAPAPAAPSTGRQATPRAAAGPAADDVVSFEDTWEEEAKATFGDLGPAESGGAGPASRGGASGPRRNPRRRRP